MTDDLPMREGETLRWAGRPHPKRIFTAADAIVIPSTIAFTAVGFHFALNAAGVARGFDLAFITVVGAFLLVGRFVVKAHRKQRTRYFITTARAVIRRPRQRFYFFEFEQKNPHLEVIRSDRYLTLRFTSDDPRSYGRVRYQIFANTGLDWFMTPGRDTRIAFDDVLRTDALDDIVEDLFASRDVSRGIA